MQGVSHRRLLFLLLFGSLSACALVSFGIYKLLGERTRIAEDLMRERSLLAAWSSAAIADEFERCHRSIKTASDLDHLPSCVGGKDGSGLFRWFAMADPELAKDAPCDTDLENKLRKEFSRGCEASGVEACVQLAQRMVSASSCFDTLVAHYGLSVLRSLDRHHPGAGVIYSLQRRLENILFKDSVRRHYKQLKELFRPTTGKRKHTWLKLGRYRFTGMPGGGSILGFDANLDPMRIQKFLLDQNILEGQSISFKMSLSQNPPHVDARSANLAFVDERVGFLLVEDPNFEAHLSQARKSNELVLFWFSLAGIILFASLIFAWLSARAAMENIRRRENFVASVSHEFRSPLGSLDLMIETLLQGKLDSQAKRQEYLHQMHKETRRLIRLSENLLASGKIQRGEKLPAEACSPGKILAMSLEMVRDLAAEKKISISVQADESLPDVAGDEDMLCIALVNLMENSVKFSPADGAVRVLASRANGFVDFIVEDDGPGISAKEQKKIFDWFYRPGDELRRTTKGTGLGLAIVREVASRYGGQIRVLSQEGSGTRMELRMPIFRDTKDKAK